MGNEEGASGVDKQIAGSLKEAIGKITGDADMRVEGETEKKAGEAEQAKTELSKKE